MNETEWREQFLKTVSECCAEGLEAVEYIRARRVLVGIRRARKSVSAFWTLANAVHLNSQYYSQESSLIDPKAWTLLIHEARHIQQGWTTALSIYGELDAWQLQMKIYKRITGKQLIPLLEEIISLPLNMDRQNLQHARELMTQYAGKNYGANLLPLYPIGKEIRFWVTRKEN